MSFELLTKWVVTELQYGGNQVELPPFDCVDGVASYIKQKEPSREVMEYRLTKRVERNPWVHGVSTCTKGSPPCTGQHRGEWCEYNEHDPAQIK